MLGDLARELIGEEVAATSQRSSLLKRVCISLSGHNIPVDALPSIENDLVYTNLIINISYKPSPKIKNANLQYVIHTDLYEGTSKRFGSYQDMLEKAKNDIVTNWIVTYTEINQDYFDIAYECAGITIPVCVRVDKYWKKLKENNDSSERRTFLIPQVLEEANRNCVESKPNRFNMYNRNRVHNYYVANKK